MPNLSALLGVIVGVLVLFLPASVALKLIGLYLLLKGILQLFSVAEGLPPAERTVPATFKPKLSADRSESDDPFRMAASKVVRRATKSSKKTTEEVDDEEFEE